MSYRLRLGIEESLLHKAMLKRRLDYLNHVSNYSVDYRRPDWLAANIANLEREHKALKARLQRKRTKHSPLL